MKIRRSAASYAALAAVATVIANAQDPRPADPGAEPAIPQYQVEIVVFGYRELDPSEEHFDHGVASLELDEPVVRREPRVYDDSSLESLTTPLDPGALGDATQLQGGDAAFQFRLLRPEELQLTREYSALGRIPAYVPLVHGGWVQQGLPEEQSRPFDLALLGVVNPSGSIRLHLSRFLHVTVDLRYQNGSYAPQPSADAFGSRELTELSFAPRFTMTAERQARSGELHYFDHPAFGLLVKVTPLPPEAVPLVPRGSEPAA
jgi:hypothetical protein